jgi:hypothetical protein
VAGDVNGDATSHDIAFVPPPASALSQAMATALAGAPASARHCLARQAGRVAARNSCTGPWSGGLDLRLELSPPWLPREAGIQLYLSNAAGALDRLLHGTAGARGWGDFPAVDPTLLVVQGFDPATREYRYQVNPRFGQRLGERAWHRPIELRIALRTPIGPSLTTQQARTQARRARASQSDPAARQRLLMVYNVFADLRRHEARLGLPREDVDSLRALEGRWRQDVDSVQTALADYLATLSDQVPDREIVARIAAANERTETITRAWRPAIRELLTDDQLERLPPSLRNWITGQEASGPVLSPEF